MDTAQAIVHSGEAIRELVSAHGAASFGDSHPLQRIWRDSEVASRHAIANPAIGAEVYGRALLGFTGRCDATHSSKLTAGPQTAGSTVPGRTRWSWCSPEQCVVLSWIESEFTACGTSPSTAATAPERC
jgi:hypothetical protein